MIFVDIINRAKGNPTASPRFECKINGTVLMADGSKIKAIMIRYRHHLPKEFASDNRKEVEQFADAVYDWFCIHYREPITKRRFGFRNDWHKYECVSRTDDTRPQDREHIVGLCATRDGKPIYCGPYLKRNLQGQVRKLREQGDKNIFAVRFKL